MSEWLKEHAWKVCIRQRIGGSNPPLTAIFEMRARTKVRALFASGPCKLSRGRHKCLARATHPTGRTINK